MKAEMNEVIVVEDVVSEDCLRKLHVMSNAEIVMQLPANAKIEQTVEAGVYHLQAEWKFWGMLDIQTRHWPKPRRLLVWSLRKGERVSEAIQAAVEMWTKAVGWEPKFAWVRSLPKGAEWCQEVHGCILLEANWIPRNCVAVGGRR
jgi:hypothetical protein